MSHADGYPAPSYTFAKVHGGCRVRIIHARLDADSEKILKEIERRLGWTSSQIIREGIKALRALLPRIGRRKIIGLGRFRSGKPDLASNKRHLDGFGR